MAKKIVRPQDIEVIYQCGHTKIETIYPEKDGTFKAYLNLCKRVVCKDCFSDDEVKKILIEGGNVEVSEYDYDGKKENQQNNTVDPAES